MDIAIKPALWTEDSIPRDCNFKAMLYDYVKRHKALRYSQISFLSWTASARSFPLHVQRSLCMKLNPEKYWYELSAKGFGLHTLCLSNDFTTSFFSVKLDYGVMENWFKNLQTRSTACSGSQSFNIKCVSLWHWKSKLNDNDDTL